jgi:hypothetical protein
LIDWERILSENFPAREGDTALKAIEALIRQYFQDGLIDVPEEFISATVC